MTFPRSINSDGTTGRTVGDIRKTINAKFEDEIRTFMETKHSRSHRREKPGEKKISTSLKKMKQNSKLTSSNNVVIR
jgi:hypothetical protein